MDMVQLELKRETIFKEAVLSQAEARSMEIIAEAGRQRAKALEAAYAQCEAADPAVIGAKLAREAEQRYASIAGQAHRDLLAWREQLMAELFGEVEEKLEAFTQSEAYEGWLLQKLAAHKQFAGDGEGITLEVRREDEGLSAALQKALPKAAVHAAPDIRLGGVRIAGGHIVYNETLDAKLEDEKKAFYASGRLRLD